MQICVYCKSDKRMFSEQYSSYNLIVVIYMYHWPRYRSLLSFSCMIFRSFEYSSIFYLFFFFIRLICTDWHIFIQLLAKLNHNLNNLKSICQHSSNQLKLPSNKLFRSIQMTTFIEGNWVFQNDNFGRW